MEARSRKLSPWLVSGPLDTDVPSVYHRAPLESPSGGWPPARNSWLLTAKPIVIGELLVCIARSQFRCLRSPRERKARQARRCCRRDAGLVPSLPQGIPLLDGRHRSLRWAASAEKLQNPPCLRAFAHPAGSVESRRQRGLASSGAQPARHLRGAHLRASARIT
jgi:hypothetical protein